MYSLEDLEVYKISVDIRKGIAKFSKELPAEEKYKLKDQLIRASRSVTANIAEGYGRYHFQEQIQYCRQARGSLFELKDHLSVSLEEDYLTEKAYRLNLNKIENAIKKMNGYIKYLQNQKVKYKK
jgi:four helix bundle protein